MKPYVTHYILTAICALCAISAIGSKSEWWWIAVGIVGTLVNLAVALDLHTQHRDRQRLRGQG